MTVPTGRLQFFTLEASDYLERLAVIAAAPTPPASDDFVRLARALRGTALMAGLNPFSQAASGVEQIAKACRDGQWDWTPANTELLADGIEELKRLVRRAGEWSDADSEAAVKLGSRLVEGVGGAPPAAPRPAPADASGG
ncbi:MAG: Hpt domain-containing protein [Gemmatimonadales bacterium]